MVRFNILTSTLIIAGFALATPSFVSAQSGNQPNTEMTAEDITKAFKKQKTRGLVIVPTDQTTANDATDTSEETVTTTAANYSAVDKADQVNIQIAFDFDSAALREDQLPKLAALCEAMKSVDVEVFQIIGHTDSSGKASYNQRLSLLRAQEVKHNLVKTCGIDENRLQAIGLGESAPFDEENPRADINRRVEFQALG